MANWHALLLDRLDETDHRLDRLVSHPALDGAELTFLQARLAHRRGHVDRARTLMSECLAGSPGHREFIGFAQEIGARLPPHSREIADEQAHLTSILSQHCDRA